MARLILAVLAVFCMSFSASASPGFFSSMPTNLDSEQAQAAAQLFKLAPECGFSLELGDRYKKIITKSGRSYLIRYDDSGRVTGFDAGDGNFIVVYSADRASGIIETTSGRAFAIPAGKGGEWYRNLRAQGKLPSIEKLIARLCSASNAKGLFEVQDPMIQDWMSQDYWDSQFGSGFGLVYLFDMTRECAPQVESCQAACDSNFDMASMSCIGMMGVATEMAGGIVGTIAGLACQASAIYQKSRCRANCAAGC